MYYSVYSLLYLLSIDLNNDLISPSLLRYSLVMENNFISLKKYSLLHVVFLLPYYKSTYSRSNWKTNRSGILFIYNIKATWQKCRRETVTSRDGHLFLSLIELNFVKTDSFLFSWKFSFSFILDRSTPTGSFAILSFFMKFL